MSKSLEVRQGTAARCFAAGADMQELREALTEAISLYLSEPGEAKHVELEDEPGSVTEHRMLARTA